MGIRILHTAEFYPPSVGGMQEVVRQLSERLVKLGHEVTVATTRLPARTEPRIGGVKIVEFNISGNAVSGMAGETRCYQDFVLNSDFDIITNFAAQQWATDLMLPLLDRIKSKKVFVPTGFSGLYRPEYKGYFASMNTWMKKYDMNVFLSGNYRDIDYARRNGVARRTIIPNGAGEDEFLQMTATDIRSRLKIPQGHFLILHVGSHTGTKGHPEAIKIFQGARIKWATMLIVANSLFGGCARRCAARQRLFKLLPQRLFDGKQLIITSLTREETVAAYREADLFLFPSRIECSPLVLFECMASRTPFLTTDAGNAGEIIEWSGSGQLLPTERDADGYCRAQPEPSARLLESIYKQPDKRDAMQAAGFAAWQERFTWERIARSYESLYLSLLDAS